MRAVTAQGTPRAGIGSRLLWRASGVVTAAVLAAAGGWLIVRAGTPSSVDMTAIPIRTVTVAQPVSSVNVQSYGAPIQVMRGSGPDVTVTEAIGYAKQDGEPAVTATVTNGQLTLAAPACNSSNCSVGFTVTVPAHDATAVTAVSDGGNILVSGVTGASLDSGGGNVWATGVTGALVVSSGGGAVVVTDTSGTNVDSGGGPVRASSVNGPLTVSSEGGPVTVAGLTGTLYAGTGGGPLFATGVSAPTATVIGEGGDVRLGFRTAPDSVQVNTGGGAALLSVPGGPYALTTDSGGGPQSVGISIDPAAARSINVSTLGGPLRVEPAGAAGSLPVKSAPPPPKLPSAPVPQ